MMNGYDSLDGQSLDDAIAGLRVETEALAKEETTNFRNKKFEAQ